MQEILPVSSIKNIGPVFQKRLQKLNIYTDVDLLYHFPFRYEDFSSCQKISAVMNGQTVTITATITKIENIFTKNRKRLTQAIITDETGSLPVIWFNQHFIKRTLKPAMKVSFSGTIDQFNHKLALISPSYEINNKISQIHTGRLVPVYPETNGISSKWLRNRISILLNQKTLTEFLPIEIRDKESLLEINSAIKTIHFPKSSQEVTAARNRFAFEELFLLQLQNWKKKQDWKQKKLGQLFAIDQHQLHTFIKHLPFTLTADQQSVIKEILDDLQKDIPMNRLLQGDVGSGKTVVACIAAYITYLNGFQTVLMAPTEVLAQQHYQTISKLLESYKIKVSLITSSQKKCLQEGYSDIIIGTHAILYHPELTQNIGLSIIDEQHRFGVAQRGKLLQFDAQNTPHHLSMTATPIPRTLALTIYGDLDLSVITQMPKGRQPIKTFLVPEHKRPNAYTWIQNKIIASNFKEQAFIIYPLIDPSQSETMQDIKAATTEYERLQKVFPKLKLGLMHGRLKSKEKTDIIKDFEQKKINILISTSVIEVGIDIPSASVMIIEHADRFGLAQLHQLRGRVGRSDLQSYCFLFSDSKSQEVWKRLKALETIHSGNKLAELDLHNRGSGEVYGFRQHGFVEFKIASLSDTELIVKTKQLAQSLYESDEKLDRYPSLRDKLKVIAQTNVVPN